MFGYKYGINFHMKLHSECIHACTYVIDLAFRFYFVSALIEFGQLTHVWCASADNIADLGTTARAVQLSNA